MKGVKCNGVREMKLLSDREMLAIRMEVAVGICTKFPDLYPKYMGKMEGDVTPDEEIAGCVLLELMELEPVICKVLELYYKS